MKIVFSNQKGGVGKTTSCREIASALAMYGKNILLVDTDPQGNLTKSFIDPPSFGLYDALSGDDINIMEINGNLSILSGDIRLSLLEKNLLGEIDAYERLRELFKADIFRDFDFILIDTPPSLGILTLNALSASDSLVIPVSCRMYSMQGTNDLVETVSKVRKSLNPDLVLFGVIINAFDRVPVIMREIRDEIRRAFGSALFEQVIGRSIKIEEAISNRSSVVDYISTGRIREEILEVTDELLKRCEL